MRTMHRRARPGLAALASILLWIGWTQIGAVAAPAASHGAPEGGPWVVRAFYEDPAQLRRIPGWLAPWAVYPERGYFLARVDRPGWDRLRALGFRLEVDAQRTARLGRENQPLPGQEAGIPGFPCYRTVEETFAAAAGLAAAHPDLATWTDIGDSWEKVDDPAAGDDLSVLRLTSTLVPGPKPALLAFGGIHAREYTPPELLTRFAEDLLGRYDVDPDVTWILDHHEIHLVLLANPDGRHRAETGLSWRKNADNDFCSDSDLRGIDLNRNFEFQWGCCNGSSPAECAETFRGPAPSSEPETQALESYFRSLYPDQRPDDLVTPAPDDTSGIFLDFHSFGGDVLWSWGFSSADPPNSDQLWALGRKMAFFNGYVPTQGSLGTVDGSTKDFAYGELGVPGFTIELGTTFFEDCATFEGVILPDNLDMLMHAAKNVREPYRTPFGPDAVDVAASELLVAAGDALELTAVVDDTRYGTAGGNQPTQAILAAEHTVDEPPWSAAATPVAMSATDGVFDEQVEDVTAAVDTSGLSVGRHLLYVRGQDVDENWGAPGATFLHVIDPATAPLVIGFVRDAASGLPLEATVSVGPFQVLTDPINGFFQLQVPAGTYDLTAEAEGHAAGSAFGLEAPDGVTLVQDFWLVPFVDRLRDDVEGGNIGWSPGGSWAISDEASFSPTHSWSDSPGAFYANNLDASLVSPPLDLGGMEAVRLTFRHLYDLEPGFDFASVEISTDGGGSWSAVASYSGLDLSWPEVTLDLPELDGAADGLVRFRMVTDAFLNGDGWHLDDIAVVAAPLPALMVSGACPGPVQVDVSSAATGGRVALLRGSTAGSSPVPAGACPEATLGIQDPQLIRTVGADVDGDVQLNARVPAAACGVLLQAVDVNTCRVSNVEAVP